MFFADVQTDNGSSLAVVHPDGHIGGKPILSFMLSILSYCAQKSRGDAPSSFPEFDRLTPHARDSLCSVSAQLIQAVVNSDWDYRDGEDYQSYLRRTGDHALGEEAFLGGAAHYLQAWTDVDVLIARVQTIILQLEIAHPDANRELLADYVLIDFRALLDTLVAAK